MTDRAFAEDVVRRLRGAGFEALWAGGCVRDKLAVREENRICTLVWQRGLLGGTFEPLIRRAPLPTAPWYAEWK